MYLNKKRSFMRANCLVKILPQIRVSTLVNAMTRALLLFVYVFLLAAALASADEADEAFYLGKAQCKSCHLEQYEKFSDSYHDLAMGRAVEDGVLGNFNDTYFEYSGVKSRFFKKDGGYWIYTQGESGKFANFAIKYTFGHYPLQQYMVEFSDGRIQVLNIAWDSRPRGEGGQRWFHLYPDEEISYRDPLHWSQPAHNWNYMCADCHSTNIDKNFNLSANTYRTTWSEIDVSCEACHGPASKHVKWANSRKEGAQVEHYGFDARLRPSRFQWQLKENMSTASAHGQAPVDHSQNMCARCHSRRAPVSKVENASSYHDAYRLEVIHDDIYYPDGQIKDEVYAYGSFLQSKMHRAGVTCMDCHDPHSTQVKMPGNALCAQCHLPDKYAQKTHHFHNVASDGAQCVNCHMPHNTYMVVDERRDHSIRIPRPDLSVEMGVPNACSQCHEDKPIAWAAKQAKKWWPKLDRHEHYGQVFFQVQRGQADALPDLLRLLSDSDIPAFVRASGLRYLNHFPLSEDIFHIVLQALQDPSPLVRSSALSLLEPLPSEAKRAVALPMLDDAVLTVRQDAVWLLSSVPLREWPDPDLIRFNAAKMDYMLSQQFNQDQASAHVNMGNVERSQGAVQAARAHFRQAIRLDGTFIPGHINLAESYRDTNNDAEGASLLKEALVKNPDSATLHYALGLNYLRQKMYDQALEVLKKAYVIDKQSASYGYTYAIALNSLGQPGNALAVLEKLVAQFPRNENVLLALATINRDQGHVERALEYASVLFAFSQNPRHAYLIEQLKSRLQ